MKDNQGKIIKAEVVNKHGYEDTYYVNIEVNGVPQREIYMEINSEGRPDCTVEELKIRLHKLGLVEVK